MTTNQRRKLPHDPAKVCGSCRFLQRPIYYSKRVLKAIEKIGKTENIRTENLAELTYEVLALHREKFWCSREECWTHLLDHCSLWQRRQRESTQDLHKEGCAL
jgi:hypothetical protein